MKCVSTITVSVDLKPEIPNKASVKVRSECNGFFVETVFKTNGGPVELTPEVYEAVFKTVLADAASAKKVVAR